MLNTVMPSYGYVRNECVAWHPPNTLADTIAELPTTPGITYRGMSGPPPNAAFTLAAILPTSANPRIASENFTSERLAAIVTVTGRSIAPLSRHPNELEISILPERY